MPVPGEIGFVSLKAFLEGRVTRGLTSVRSLERVCLLGGWGVRVGIGGNGFSWLIWT